MLEFLDEQKDTAQSLIFKLLQLTEEDIKKASLRDKMGAIKILSEVFAPSTGTEKSERKALDKIVDGLDELRQSDEDDDKR